jgi:hypothetical protein
VNATNASQRSAARVAGAAFLIAFPSLAVANFGLRGPLADTDDPAQTIQFVAEAGSMFRLSIALDLVYCLGLIVLLSALYIILSPVGRFLALLASLTKLVYALTSVLVALSLLTTLHYASDSAYSEALGTGPLEAMVRINSDFGWDLYYVGLVFWALSSTLFAWLWLRSGYVPAALAVFGLLSSAWCLICATAYIAVPQFSSVVNVWLFDTPMAVFYVVLSVWLLLRGLRGGPPPGDAKPRLRPEQSPSRP